MSNSLIVLFSLYNHFFVLYFLIHLLTSIFRCMVCHCEQICFISRHFLSLLINSVSNNHLFVFILNICLYSFQYQYVNHRFYQSIIIHYYNLFLFIILVIQYHDLHHLIFLCIKQCQFNQLCLISNNLVVILMIYKITVHFNRQNYHLFFYFYILCFIKNQSIDF